MGSVSAPGGDEGKAVTAESGLESLSSDPFEQFGRWYEEACRLPDVKYPNAFVLSTTHRDGGPDSRVVLLRGWDERGFSFFTNYHSAKSDQLWDRPVAAMTFYWEKADRQVRIRGSVERVSESDSDSYFASRPRISQLGAWASLQSRPLSGRNELEVRLREVEKSFEGAEVTRPSHWGGWRICPYYFEFWREQPYRLHDRCVYTRSANVWVFQRLYP